MTLETWNLYPRLIEQKINGLLDEAEPNNAKAYQLYKTCKNENLWRNSYELFTVHLSDFFSLPKSQRNKSYFDNFLDRPMNRYIFDGFQLTFRTAIVNSQALTDIAEWSHDLMKINCKTDSLLISADILIKTLQHIVNPPAFEKDRDIEFEDFCIAWKKTVFTLFGKKYNPELEKILKEVRWLNNLQKNPEIQPPEKRFLSGIYLTQTEIDWTASIQEAVFDYKTAPEFPLSRGPVKELLINLEKSIRLYNIIHSTNRPEIIQHRENIRNTILDQCGRLLRERVC